MTKHYELKQRYPDVLGQEDDHALDALVSDLDELYTKPEMPHWLTWATTKARATEDLATTKQVLPRRLMPLRRFSFSMGTALALVLLFVTIAGAASFALSPLVRQVLGFTQTQSKGIPEERFTVLNQEKTINGMRIKLEAAYADANEIIIGLYSQSIDGKKHAIDAMLKTKQGQKLRSNIGVFEAEGIQHDLGEGWYYDATEIHGNPQNLDLVLDVLVERQQTSFAFTIPFHGGKTIQVNQSVTSIGETVTLEKVVMAPSGTTLIVKGLSMKKRYALLEGSLKVPGSPEILSAAAIVKLSPDDQFVRLLYGGGLMNKRGRWSLTIEEQPVHIDPNAPKGGMQTFDRQGKEATVQVSKDIIAPKDARYGKWTFNFNVP